MTNFKTSDFKTTSFDFTDEQFLIIINHLFKLDADMGEEFVPIKTMDEKITIEKLDSLSAVVFFIWISELFGIPEDTVSDYMNSGKNTGTDLKDFVMKNATQTYKFEDALEYSKRCF
jgi:hypothetical protein